MKFTLFPVLFLRWLFCLLLVFTTYNPWQYSYLHWLREGDPSWKLAWVGVVLVGAYVLVFQVILSSIGLSGLLAGGVITAASSLELIRLRPDDQNLNWVLEVLLLVALASTLSVGLAWAQIATWLTGQKYKRYLTKKPKLP
ncbi:MAG: DUF6524 family protein [Alphaproteobacteria bacterium]